MEKIKGGIEGIIAVVVLVGIVIALIIAVVLPMANSTEQTGSTATSRIGGLESAIAGQK